MLPIRNSRRVLLFQIYPVWRGPASDMRLPLGMLYLAQSLKKAGYGVEVFHLENSEVDTALPKVDFRDVLFVGVCSVMTGFSLRCAMDFSQKIKDVDSNIPVVWGGVQATAIPRECLEHPYVDAVGCGEGEELIVDIAGVFAGTLDPAAVKGLAFRDNEGKTVVNEKREFIADLDMYAPDYSLIDLNKYIFNGRITGLMMSSRGCPFKCTFCYNYYYNKGRWRTHSLSWVLRVLEGLKSEYRFESFSFSDDNFFVDRKRSIAILKGASELGLRTFSVDIKINNISDEDIEAMAACKVESVFFGTESLNPRLIKLIDKRQTKERVVEIISKFARLAPDVAVQTEILMALPFERMSEMRQDIREGLSLYAHNRNFSLYFGVLFPLPGTRMLEYAGQNGFAPKTLDDFAGIDLNTAWSLCDRWVLFDLSRKEKKKLYLTEKYSGLIAGDRRLKSASLKDIVMKLKNELMFRLAKFRLSHWFFFGYRLDFFIERIFSGYLYALYTYVRKQQAGMTTDAASGGRRS